MQPSEKQRELENLATMFDGRKYGEEVSDEEEAKLKDRGVVMMFGTSDDLVEIRGAINSTVDAYKGTDLFFHNGKLLESECEDKKCPYFKELQKQNQSKSVKALWCEDETDDDFTWSFKTDIPHATFEIFDGAEDFCRGILFYVDEVKESGNRV